MVCTQCGGQQISGATSCPRCGTAFSRQFQFSDRRQWMPFSHPAGYGAPALPEPRTRVQQNVQALGILWCMFGIYRLIHGFIAAFVLHQIAIAGSTSGDLPTFVAGMLAGFAPYVAFGSVLMAALSLVAGFGLLNRKPWARTLAIVLALLALIKLPVGTAVGIYTLWVMASNNAAAEWETLQRA